jgi:hypothetical protein
MSTQYPSETTLLPPSPLLATESKNDFDQILEALVQEIEPRGIVERMFVGDIAHLSWDILRYRRCKAGIINFKLRDALENLLQDLLHVPGESLPFAEAKNLAYRWFSNQKARKQVLKLLEQFNLDESAIEAEAIRVLAANLEQLDRLLASAESRRNKALRNIAEYRDVFARQLRESSDRIVEGKVFGIEHKVNRAASAGAQI